MNPLKAFGHSLQDLFSGTGKPGNNEAKTPDSNKKLPKPLDPAAAASASDSPDSRPIGSSAPSSTLAWKSPKSGDQADTPNNGSRRQSDSRPAALSIDAASSSVVPASGSGSASLNYQRNSLTYPNPHVSLHNSSPKQANANSNSNGSKQPIPTLKSLFQPPEPSSTASSAKLASSSHSPASSAAPVAHPASSSSPSNPSHLISRSPSSDRKASPLSSTPPLKPSSPPSSSSIGSGSCSHAPRVREKLSKYLTLPPNYLKASSQSAGISIFGSGNSSLSSMMRKMMGITEKSSNAASTPPTRSPPTHSKGNSSSSVPSPLLVGESASSSVVPPGPLHRSVSDQIGSHERHPSGGEHKLKLNSLPPQEYNPMGAEHRIAHRFDAPRSDSNAESVPGHWQDYRSFRHGKEQEQHKDGSPHSATSPISPQSSRPALSTASSSDGRSLSPPHLTGNPPSPSALLTNPITHGQSVLSPTSPATPSSASGAGNSASTVPVNLAFLGEEITQWSVDQVNSWLWTLGLGEYNQFASRKIDGDLLADLTDDDLKELGVEEKFHRRKILKKIREQKEKFVRQHHETGDTHFEEGFSTGKSQYPYSSTPPIAHPHSHSHSPAPPAAFSPEHYGDFEGTDFVSDGPIDFISVAHQSHVRHVSQPFGSPAAASPSTHSRHHSSSHAGHFHPHSHHSHHSHFHPHSHPHQHSHLSHSQFHHAHPSSSSSSSSTSSPLMTFSPPQPYEHYIWSSPPHALSHSQSDGSGTMNKYSDSPVHFSAVNPAFAGKSLSADQKAPSGDPVTDYDIPIPDVLDDAEAWRQRSNSGPHHHTFAHSHHHPHSHAHHSTANPPQPLPFAPPRFAPHSGHHPPPVSTKLPGPPPLSRPTSGAPASANSTPSPSPSLPSQLNSAHRQQSVPILPHAAHFDAHSHSQPPMNRPTSNSGASQPHSIFAAAGLKSSLHSGSLTIISINDLSNLERLNEGVAGIAYRAVYRGLSVVVKAPKSNNLSNQEWLEMQIHLALPDHPNLVPFLGVIVLHNQMYFVTRNIAKGSLKGLLTDPHTRAFYSQPLIVVRAGIEIGSGLLHLHRHHIVHRDVSARNILVDENDTFYVADLGLSRWMSSKPKAPGSGVPSARNSITGKLKSESKHAEDGDSKSPSGSPQAGATASARVSTLELDQARSAEDSPDRLSPAEEIEEVYEMEKATALPARWTSPDSLRTQLYTSKSDVYSLGVCLVEMLSGGELPLAHIKDNLQVIALLCSGELHLNVPSSTPPALAQLISQALLHDANHRIDLPSLVAGFKRLFRQWTGSDAPRSADYPAAPFTAVRDELESSQYNFS